MGYLFPVEAIKDEGWSLEIIDQGGHGWYMTDRSTSNQPNEVPKPSPEGHPNTVKRNEGPVKPTDTTPTSEPLAEHPEIGNEKPSEKPRL